MVRKIFSPFCVRNLMFVAMAASACGMTGASSTAFAQAGGASSASEQVIIHAPEIIRRNLPRNGPGTPPGLLNPEIISLSRAVSYADLNLAKASDVTELETRVKDTARDICQELDRQFPKTGGQYVRANVDCVKKAVDDGLQVVKQVTAARN